MRSRVAIHCHILDWIYMILLPLITETNTSFKRPISCQPLVTKNRSAETPKVPLTKSHYDAYSKGGSAWSKAFASPWLGAAAPSPTSRLSLRNTHPTAPTLSSLLPATITPPPAPPPPPRPTVTIPHTPTPAPGSLLASGKKMNGSASTTASMSWNSTTRTTHPSCPNRSMNTSSTKPTFSVTRRRKCKLDTVSLQLLAKPWDRSSTAYIPEMVVTGEVRSSRKKPSGAHGMNLARSILKHPGHAKRR